ncbi:DgyrCDS9511 [Dimorphilus gyrociliatus]|uniref:L-serine ammonia-lyase n=1 Tax=Dimorphilus gyrociliatus TaxID=2664684 RepID=A0A7I8VYV2_9ANNE|nr:DgyrCDS9511 [Dimorphilus gyrociliatus]
MLHVKSPLIKSTCLSKLNNREVYLKLENTQPAATFKIRGIGHKIQKEIKNGKKEFVISSGGNAGYAAAYAANNLNVPMKIFVPQSTDRSIIDKLEDENANVEVAGQFFDQANERALEYARSNNEVCFIHPFDDPDLWIGHETLIQEIVEQTEKPETIIASVGGGGLAMGIINGLVKAGWDDVNLVTIETKGADCFYEAIKAKNRITLPKITSIANCLGALRVCEGLYDAYAKQTIPIKPYLVSDKDSIVAIRKFLDDHRIFVEPACGATLAALYSKEINLAPKGGKIVAIVCGGAGISMRMLEDWEKKLLN